MDEGFAQWINWLLHNTTQREKDLIYITENYSKAWLTASEIRMGQIPNSWWKNQLKQVNSALKRLNYPMLKVTK